METHLPGTVALSSLRPWRAGRNSEGEVVGLVRAQSNSADPKLVNDVGPNAFNVAVPMDIVIDTIRQSGALDPQTLEKFNASVIE